MQKSKTLSLACQDVSEDSAKDIKKAAKGAGISFIGSAVGRGAWFLSQVIIARFFGPEIFGLYVLGLTVLKITDVFSQLGLHTGAIRYISIYRNKEHGKLKGVIIVAPLIAFLNGIFIGGLVYYFAGHIATMAFHKPELINIIETFAFCTPFMAAMMVVASASQGFHTSKYLVYIKDIIQPFVNLALIILFIKLGFDISWVIGAFVISHAIALFFGIYFVLGKFHQISKECVKPVFNIKELLGYSAPLMFSGFMALLVTWTDTIMLGFMKTATEVAIYRASAQITVFLTLFLAASNSIYAPAVAEMYHAGDMHRLENIFKTTTRWLFQIVLPICLIFIFSAREVISVFGARYDVAGSRVLIVLTMAQLVNCVTGGVSYTLSMTGKQNALLINSLAMVVINIALNYFLIPLYGSYGAAIATGISIGTINLVRLIQVYFYYKIHPYDVGYLQGIVCAIIAIVALYLLDNYVIIDDYLLINKHLLNHSMLVRLVSNSFVVGVVFVAGYILKGVTDADKFVFTAFAKKFNFRSRN